MNIRNKNYKPIGLWAKIPHGIWIREATSVSVDSMDNVYIFNRGNIPILKFDTYGNLIDKWGTEDPYSEITTKELRPGVKLQSWSGSNFTRPHSIRIDRDDNMWLVDDSGNMISKYDLSFNLKLQIGDGNPSERESGIPFNRPTDVTIRESTGEIFISDGYGNSRVHHFDPEGKLIKSWGESGTSPGKFSLPHNLVMINDQELLVCDRENHRVQIFHINGEFIREWHVHKAVAVTVDMEGKIYIAEQGPPPVQKGVKNLGHSVGIWNDKGELIERLGSEFPGEKHDQFLWPHSIAVDSKGTIYVAEVSFVEVGRTLDPPREMASFRVWEKLSNNQV